MKATMKEADNYFEARGYTSELVLINPDTYADLLLESAKDNIIQQKAARKAMWRKFFQIVKEKSIRPVAILLSILLLIGIVLWSL